MKLFKKLKNKFLETTKSEIIKIPQATESGSRCLELCIAAILKVPDNWIPTRPSGETYQDEQIKRLNSALAQSGAVIEKIDKKHINKYKKKPIISVYRLSRMRRHAIVEANKSKIYNPGNIDLAGWKRENLYFAVKLIKEEFDNPWVH